MATRANGQPAIGLYIKDPATGLYRASGVIVVTLAGDKISALTRFENSVLASFGLPRTLLPNAEVTDREDDLGVDTGLAHHDALALDRSPFGLEQPALALALDPGAVAVDHTPPRQGLIGCMCERPTRPGAAPPVRGRRRW